MPGSGLRTYPLWAPSSSCPCASLERGSVSFVGPYSRGSFQSLLIIYLRGYHPPEDLSYGVEARRDHLILLGVLDHYLGHPHLGPLPGRGAGVQLPPTRGEDHPVEVVIRVLHQPVTLRVEQGTVHHTSQTSQSKALFIYPTIGDKVEV